MRIMKINRENVIMAAIAVVIQLPISANAVIEISEKHGVDHRDVMSMVGEMISTELVACNDMDEQL